jgi:DNA (cytosine-5)-methyltransferase 1
MSWLYSQALVEEYLGDNFSDGEQSVPLNGSHTQLAYLPPDKMTAFSRLSRFGMTFKPLTENLGEELLKSFREDFHVRDISIAGKGDGLDGERSGMWRQMARIICEVGPEYVFVENSPMLVSRGLGAVLGDLSSMGFDAKWGIVGAKDVGANHQRDRIWIVAHSNSNGWTTRKKSRSLGASVSEQQEGQNNSLNFEGASSLPTTEANVSDSKCLGWQERSTFRGASENKESANNIGDGSGSFGEGELSDSMCNGLQGSRSDGIVEGQIGLRCRKGRNEEQNIYASDSAWWSVEPELGRVAHGVADRVHRLKAIGNGQVPLCAATAWGLLK